MFRKLAAILLIALALATLGLYARAVMSPLTLTIGSAPVALVQNGVVTRTVISSPAQGPVPATLPAASTAGTTLLVIIGWPATGPASTSVVVSFPAGWTRLVTATSAAPGGVFEAWVYPNNPGGILSISIPTTTTLAGGIAWRTHMSEWSGLTNAATAEASGTATATAGTTLSVVTTGTVVTAGDLVIAAWAQGCAATPPVYTTPAGFTRLIADDGNAGASAGYLDIEYRIAPPTGATVSATLTSNQTSTTAAGAIIVLKAAPPVTDQTAYIAY